MSLSLRTFQALAASGMLVLSTLAQAAPAYGFSWIEGTGDTVDLYGMDDAGDLLLNGYGDLGGGGRSMVIPRGGQISGGFVTGLPKPDGGDAREGVLVSQINSAGDMIGTSYVPSANGGNGTVKTFWRGGVAYDMSLPANAGLVFVPDPGAVSIQINLAALSIVDLPAEFLSNPADYLPNSALTNAKGEYAFVTLHTSPFGSGRAALLIPIASVPEPGTIALWMIGISLLGVTTSRRRSKIDR